MTIGERHDIIYELSARQTPKNRINKGFLRDQLGRRETENKLNLLDGRMQRESGKNFQKENEKKVLTNERQHDIITKSLERAVTKMDLEN